MFPTLVHSVVAHVAGVFAILCGLSTLAGALPPDWGATLTGICSLLYGLGLISASKTSRPVAILAVAAILPFLGGCSGATIKQLQAAGSALIGIGGALYQDVKESVDCSRQVIAGIPSSSLPDCAKSTAPVPAPVHTSQAPVLPAKVWPPLRTPPRERLCFLDANGEHCVIP